MYTDISIYTYIYVHIYTYKKKLLRMNKNVKINPFNILQKKHEVSLPQSIFS